MILSGKAWKVGDDIGATDLVSAKHDKLGMSGQFEECSRYLLEDIDPEFAQAVRPGDMIVAGRNFGNGHAHYYNAAVMTCRAAGIAATFAESVNGLFQRASIDQGLPTWVFEGLHDLVDNGDQLEIDLAQGFATNRTSGKTRQFKPVSPIILDILAADGSRNWALRRVGAAG
jgi:3-isopropylmalate dehydratase small subunit